MGQQQLLLLVLGVVIVGLAVVAGLGAFSVNHTKANADALVSDALRIASDVQAWALKPGLAGGRRDSQSVADATFDALGYPDNDGTYSSVNGDFTLSKKKKKACAPATIPSGKAAVIYVNASNPETGTSVCVAIAGTSAGDIGTSIAPSKGKGKEKGKGKK